MTHLLSGLRRCLPRLSLLQCVLPARNSSAAGKHATAAPGSRMKVETRRAILAMLLRVAKANDHLDLIQIDRLYSEFVGGTLTPPALQFAADLYLESADYAGDPGPFPEVMDPEDRMIIAAAGFAVGFEQGKFSDLATRCIANAAHAMQMTSSEIESSLSLLEPAEPASAVEDSNTEPMASVYFRSVRERPGDKAA